MLSNTLVLFRIDSDRIYLSLYLRAAYARVTGQHFLNQFISKITRRVSPSFSRSFRATDLFRELILGGETGAGKEKRDIRCRSVVSHQWQEYIPYRKYLRRLYSPEVTLPNPRLTLAATVN